MTTLRYCFGPQCRDTLVERFTYLSIVAAGLQHFALLSCWDGLKPPAPWWTSGTAASLCQSNSSGGKVLTLLANLPQALVAYSSVPLEEQWAFMWSCSCLLVFLMTFVPHVYKKHRTLCVVATRCVPTAIPRLTLMIFNQPSSHQHLYLYQEGALIAWRSAFLRLPGWLEPLWLVIEYVMVILMFTTFKQRLPPTVNTFSCLLQVFCWMLLPLGCFIYGLVGIRQARSQHKSDKVTTSNPRASVRQRAKLWSAPLSFVSEACTKAHSVALRKEPSWEAPPQEVEQPIPTSPISPPPLNPPTKLPHSVQQQPQATAASRQLPLPSTAVARSYASARAVAQDPNRKTYHRKLRHVSWHYKIPFAEPEHLPPDYPARLQQGLQAEHPAWCLVGMYVRSGCIQLALHLVGPSSESPPSLSAARVLSWLGLPSAPVTDTSVLLDGGQASRQDQHCSCIIGSSTTISSNADSSRDATADNTITNSCLSEQQESLLGLQVVPAVSGRCEVLVDASVANLLQPNPENPKPNSQQLHGLPEGPTGVQPPVILRACMQGRCLQVQPQEALGRSGALSMAHSRGSGAMLDVAGALRAVEVQGVESDGLVLLEWWWGGRLVAERTALVIRVDAAAQPAGLEQPGDGIISAHNAGDGTVDCAERALYDELRGATVEPAFLRDLGLWWDWVGACRATSLGRQQPLCQCAGFGQQRPEQRTQQQQQPEQRTRQQVLQQQPEQRTQQQALQVQWVGSSGELTALPWEGMCHTAAVFFLGYACQQGLQYTASRLLSDLAGLGYPAASLSHDVAAARAQRCCSWRKGRELRHACGFPVAGWVEVVWSGVVWAYGCIEGALRGFQPM